MIIYKVRAWVNQRSKKSVITHPFEVEKIVIDNLETATKIFNNLKNEVDMYKGIVGTISGYCKLFEPHIFTDGTLAYWPDDDKFIMTYEF